MPAKIVVLIFLIYLTIADVKRQCICLVIPVAGSVLALLLHWVLEKSIFSYLFTAMLFLLFFFFVSKVTKGQLGGGDAFAFGMTGAAVGFWQNVCVVYIAFILAFFGAVYQLLRKRGRNHRMPFLPFLCLAYLLFLFIKSDPL